MKFNVVGVAGMLVQLVTLAGLNHIVSGHYLLISLIAVETAILHNFVAHVHYTWRDRNLRSAWHDRNLRSAWRDRNLRSAWRNRRSRKALLGALWRFQVSNGGVSLAGNFVLIRLLVGRAHLPVMVANVIAIGVCSLVNFRLGDRWTFAARGVASLLYEVGVDGSGRKFFGKARKVSLNRVHARRCCAVEDNTP
jgi:putative flippase GtrA